MIRRLPGALSLSIVFLAALPRPSHTQELYNSAQLSCAAWRETVHAIITTQIGGQTRHEETGEDGTMVVIGRDSAGGLALEAWFDSLAVFRDAAEGHLAPETDGVIGGRFRGFLTPQGRYLGRQVPFIPPEVAEVVHLAVALDDLLPELAPVSLISGASWSDGAGLTIRRLEDSIAAGASLRRYELRHTIPDRPLPAPDSTGIDVVQGEDHRGIFVWHPDHGLLRWDREIVIRTLVPPGRDIRQAVRAKVVEHMVLDRLPRCDPRAQ